MLLLFQICTYKINVSDDVVRTFVQVNAFVISWRGSDGRTGRPLRVIFFPTLVPGSGNFQLSRLAGLGYGLWLGFWVVITTIVSLTLTLTLITTLTVILP